MFIIWKYPKMCENLPVYPCNLHFYCLYNVQSIGKTVFLNVWNNILGTLGTIFTQLKELK